jgi:hypothetical protein
MTFIHFFSFGSSTLLGHFLLIGLVPLWWVSFLLAIICLRATDTDISIGLLSNRPFHFSLRENNQPRTNMQLSTSFILTLLITTFTLALTAPVPAGGPMGNRIHHYAHKSVGQEHHHYHHEDNEGIHRDLQRRTGFTQKLVNMKNKVVNLFSGNKNKKQGKGGKGGKGGKDGKKQDGKKQDSNNKNNRKDVMSWGGISHASTEYDRMNLSPTPFERKMSKSKHPRRGFEFAELEELD